MAVKKRKKYDLVKLIASLVLCQIAGGIGALFTTPAIPTWYATLKKPFFSPPNWVFGPVWTILYLLMGFSLYLIWVSPAKNKENAYTFFGIQLALNTLWSSVFFGSRSPFWGFVVILALAAFIFLTIVEFRKISKKAAVLLYPYLAWVAFASVLNFAVFLLNYGY
jgi:benzodiazapine receptor